MVMTNMVLKNMVLKKIVLTNMVQTNMILTKMVLTNRVLTNMDFTSMVFLTNMLHGLVKHDFFSSIFQTNMVVKHGLNLILNCSIRSLGLTFNLVCFHSEQECHVFFLILLHTFGIYVQIKSILHITVDYLLSGSFITDLNFLL